MAGEREIEIVIRGKNLTGDTFSEVSKGLTGISTTATKASGTMSTAFEKTSSAMSTAFGVLASTQLAQFSGAMGGFFKDLLGGAEEYAKQVEDLSRLTGSSVEDASRFIQIADDMRMSYADLSNALKLYSKTQKDAGNAADLSIDTLADLSDAYLSLPEGINSLARTNLTPAMPSSQSSRAV